MGSWQSSTRAGVQDHHSAFHDKITGRMPINLLIISYAWSSWCHMYFAFIFRYSQGLHVHHTNNNGNGNVVIIPVDESKGAEVAFQCKYRWEAGCIIYFINKVASRVVKERCTRRKIVLWRLCLLSQSGKWILFLGLHNICRIDKFSGVMNW